MGLLKRRRNALDCTTNTLKELVKETVRSILYSKPDIVINNSRASMSTITQLILELDGDFTLQPDQQLRLRQRTGSSTTIGSRIKVGTHGELQPGLNSNFFNFFLFRLSFSLAGNFNSLAIDGGCGQVLLPHVTF